MTYTNQIFFMGHFLLTKIHQFVKVLSIQTISIYIWLYQHVELVLPIKVGETPIYR